jgi:transmembrane sensor
MKKYPSDPFVHDVANRDVEGEALQWVVRLTSGEVVEDDTAAFAAWHEDAQNASAYARAVKLWRDLGPILVEHDVDAVAERPAANDRVWRLPRWAAAAAAVLLTLSGSYQYVHVWQFDHVSPAARRDIATTLPDGTQVALGPDTAFDTRFEGGQRIVRLARGEAYFDVTHDAQHPFLVEAGGGSVQVLGTAFSVRERNDGSVDVVVTRGRVAVARGDARAVLTPDRAVHFDATKFGPVRAVDASLNTAWMRGRLIMENKPLSEVLAELNRYSGRSIILMNEAAGQRRVNVVVDLDRIDGWLTALGTSQRLKIDRLGPVVLVR